MTKTMSLRLPDELHERLRQEAFDQRTSINGIIIRVLEEVTAPYDALIDPPVDETPCTETFDQVLYFGPGVPPGRMACDQTGPHTTHMNQALGAAWTTPPTALAEVAIAEPTWKYGWYDSADRAISPAIVWYVFGFLTYDTAESAEQSGLKSTTGHPIIVRRREGQSEWEHEPAGGIDQ
ncbi:toxin-antitoxin system HicB family antitoxin [Glaciihabitans sp. dw_435]|uniref:toxin-antitoxin system HicB family antitoxin n=1 Tax=Glaciihabitans sp. dw_435 TaxID=2720081 RepID=UPI001BD3D509|nr:toxin-antitoxin system HicB family antitoxin [Glaciihabitans sp. dw_435]